MPRVRRTLAIISLVIALATGGIIGRAAPAAAHHSHSPSTLCAYITQTHPSWVPTSYHSHYNAVGHPVWAHCVYYVRTTFAPRDMCRNYLYHTIWDC